jgi:hypothetical protein
MKKLTPSQMKYVLYFMLIVFVVSSFAFIGNLSTGSKEVSASIVIAGLSTPYSESFKVPEGANLYYLLYNTGFVSFQSDYQIKCVGSYCNDYISGNYWQIFLGDYFADLNYVINGSEEFVLYYGKRIEFFNVSLVANISGFIDNASIRLSETIGLGEFLGAYNYSANDNGTCILGLCGNWIILVNDLNVSADYELSENDSVYLEFK